MNHLDMTPEFLAAHGATWTAREIAQQPQVWRESQALLTKQRAALAAFLEPILVRQGLRIILTGAGTSSYVGECLVPTLLRQLQRRVEAIATTDLVAVPRDYLQRAVPTLLVSFSRSGGSPESVAALELADQCLDECWHLIVTCNAEGELNRRAQGNARSYALLLPPATHDQGFAMTSSYSAMLYAAQAAFCGIEASASRVAAISQAAEAVLATHNMRLRTLAAADYDRAVFLGSGCHQGLAAEAALKLLELSDGAVAASANTPLGFRHGPKAIVKRSTLVVMFIANDALARQYELDLLRELQRDGAAGALLAISALPPPPDLPVDWLQVPGMASAADAELLFPYVVCAQLYALYRSLQLGNTPDTPCASGAVNRVVQGVTIHPLQAH